ncbi:MAG: hypothetical protein KDC46_05790 [Thermoleophilia bacterium]|nr:hypothetical protein [Thermoleophilia bacterium]
MNIQPAFNAQQTRRTEGAFLSNGAGGDGRGNLEGVRADWNVRMNISHETGFVGGAGRLLVHNLVADERRELVLLLPAALTDRPGRLDLASAEICSAKPGIAAAPGQSLPFRAEGAKVIVTIPTLQLNDWVYVDLTWTGGFPQGGMSYPAAQIPVGDFHPQIAIPVTTDDGQAALGPVAARYDVELGADNGAVVRLERDDLGGVESKPNADGTMTMHEFKSYGTSRIDALLAPPGTVA